MMDLYIVHPMHNLKFVETLMIRPNMNFAMVACGLFILISGATISINKRNEGIIEFYKKRLLRVLIPFYIAYIIYFIIKVFTNHTIFIFGGVPKWRFIFTIFGMDEYLSANGIRTFSLGVGEWFLGCIILCYLVYPLLYKVHKKNRLVTFILMTIYYVLINLNYDKFNFKIVSYMNFLCQIYNFYLGIAIADTGMLKKIKKWSLAVTIPIILFFYFCSVNIPMPDNFKTTIVIVSLLITFYQFEDLLSNSVILKKVIMIFNEISLEIFLVHHFIIYQVDYMLGYRRLSGVETLAVIIGNFILTILLSIIVKKISSIILVKIRR